MNPRQATRLIVLAEFLGTSLWFTANGVAGDLAHEWGLGVTSLGWLTAAVQGGFISGTLLFALTGLADRFSASRIFFASALLGAAANAAFAYLSPDTFVAGIWRFLTGVALAGIYPLGMKLIVSWSPQRRGEALGWLVGMLCLGTAAPHLLRGVNLQTSGQGDWRMVVLAASVLAVLAGLIVRAVGDGPAHLAAGRFNWGGVLRAFNQPAFRAAAFGYFGHMWELYALWTIAPLLVASQTGISGPPLSLTAFGFIAAGALGCIGGGRLSRRFGSIRVAFGLLTVSGAFCLFYPAVELQSSSIILLCLFVWAVAVAGDSPQFSALVSAAAPQDAVGSALAVVNGAGFLISILSLMLLTAAWQQFGVQSLWLLAPGPLFGLIAMRSLLRD